MGRRISIPIKVVQPVEYQDRPSVGQRLVEVDTYPGSEDGLQPETPLAAADRNMAPAVERPTPAWKAHADDRPTKQDTAAGPPAQSAVVEFPAASNAEAEAKADEWRALALRLQTEMDSFRRLQQRRAQEQIESERLRLLGAFLPVVDDLERAMATPASHRDGIRRGVELTHRAALQLLQREGVERFDAKDRAFDPNWHEAVAAVERSADSLDSNTVVQVVESGYRLGEQLLRPAKVVVAI